MELEQLFDEFAVLIARALARRWLVVRGDGEDAGEKTHPTTPHVQKSDPTDSKSDGVNEASDGRG